MKSYSKNVGYTGFYFKDGYVYRGKNYSNFSTTKGKEVCEEWIDLEKQQLQKDPNNTGVEYETNIKETTEKEYAEWHIFKRRQRTKNGAENPESPCDDKGLPLYVDDENKLTTKSNNNEPAWGDWVDGSEKGVSIETVTIPKGRRCSPDTIVRRYRRYPSTKEMAMDFIKYDKKHHDKQQKRRKNKIKVEYKPKLIKKEVIKPKWECSIKVKREEYPEDWDFAKYDPRKNPEKTPIVIHLRWKKKRNNQWVTTGAGNFKGRKKLKERARAGKLFAKKTLLENINKYDFKGIAYKYGGGSQYKLKVPDSDDFCVISVSWSSSDPSFGYVGPLHKLGVRKGPPYPIGGYKEFRWGDFSIQKGVKKKTEEEIEELASKPEVDPDAIREQYEKDLKFYEYEKKAPEETVDFCFDVFDDITKDSIVEISEDIKKIYF